MKCLKFMRECGNDWSGNIVYMNLNFLPDVMTTSRATQIIMETVFILQL